MNEIFQKSIETYFSKDVLRENPLKEARLENLKTDFNFYICFCSDKSKKPTPHGFFQYVNWLDGIDPHCFICGGCCQSEKCNDCGCENKL